GGKSRVLIRDRLRKWQEEHRFRRLTDIAIFCIFHDANDLEIAPVSRLVITEMMADGVLIGEKSRYESLIHDRNTRGGNPVAFLESAPSQQSGSDSLEVSGADARIPCAIYCSAGYGLSVNLQSCSPIPIIEGRVQRVTRTYGARNPRQAIVKLAIQHR